MALGDSYTIGEGVDKKDRWPELLSEQLETEWKIDIDLKLLQKRDSHVLILTIN